MFSFDKCIYLCNPLLILNIDSVFMAPKLISPSLIFIYSFRLLFLPTDSFILMSRHFNRSKIFVCILINFFFFNACPSQNGSSPKPGLFFLIPFSNLPILVHFQNLLILPINKTELPTSCHLYWLYLSPIHCYLLHGTKTFLTSFTASSLSFSVHSVLCIAVRVVFAK